MRRSVRRFKPVPEPATVVDMILFTATFAPSAHNLQPWRFVQVESVSAKKEFGLTLTRKMCTDMEAENTAQAEIKKRTENSLRRIAEAPVIIILCRDRNIIPRKNPEEKIMAMQSTALAGLQLLLATQAEGLGGNWICWVLYAQKEIINALDLPENWLPEAMFFIGYTDGNAKEKNLPPLSEIVKRI